MLAALTLSDILSRRLQLQWYEGVAIVRGVAARLLEHQGAEMRIPELHQIVLLADGYVTLNGGATVSEPVRRLGQLTQALLADANVPVQLRLIVSRATAPISYSSLAEYNQALAYFERPDHTGILKALFARAEVAGPMTAGDAAPTLDSIAPLSDTKADAPLAQRHRKHLRRLIATAAVLVGVAIVSGAAVLYGRTASATVKGGDVARATMVAADAVGTAVLASVSAVSDRVGLGRIVAANAADAAPGSPAALPSARALKMQPARSVSASVNLVRADIEGVPPRTVIAYEVAQQRASVNEAPLQPGAALKRLADAPIDSVVYAIGTDGVLPPVGVHPQLPQQLPPTVDPANLSRIELIIAPDGSVESARLLGDRRDLQGGMFLSATKAWRFRPATKDGTAVRYRMTILVSFE